MQTRLLFITVILAALLAARTDAQEAKPGTAPAAQRRLAPEERLKVLTAALVLTPDQQEKVRDVYEKNEVPRKKLRANQSLSAVDRRVQLRKLSTAEKDEIKAILTPEQKQKWEELMAKNAENKAKGEAAAPAEEK